MAGFIIACSRDRSASPLRGDDLRRCALYLSPDDITPNPPNVHEEDGLARAVLNPVPGVRIAPGGVCLGALFEDADWAAVGAAAPDGTYAILRHDDEAVELLSDTFGSRTVWYVHTDALFLASTSQRALVALLGSFVPRAETATWLLAAGNLGPDCAWDERLRRLPIAACLRLDRRRWTLSTTCEELEYVPQALPEEEHLERLREAIFGVCAKLDVESSRHGAHAVGRVRQPLAAGGPRRGRQAGDVRDLGPRRLARRPQERRGHRPATRAGLRHAAQVLPPGLHRRARARRLLALPARRRGAYRGLQRLHGRLQGVGAPVRRRRGHHPSRRLPGLGEPL